MNPNDLFPYIRRIQIKAQNKVENLFSGAYRSAFKGTGLEFEDVREYQPGDEIRRIDWNITARHHKPYIKILREERQLTVFLLIDLSNSSLFGSQKHLKKDIIAELAAILAFSASTNQDNVGLILFTDEVELYLRPKKNIRHILRIIRELLYFQPKSKGTNINKALHFLGQIQKKHAICFLISDFFSPNFSKEAESIAKKHELILFDVRDPHETNFPQIGLSEIQDLETGDRILIDTSSKEMLEYFLEESKKKLLHLQQLSSRIGASFISFDIDEISPENALHKFFKLRQTK